MRILIAAPLLLAAACAVERDLRNGQTTIGFDETIITNTADRIGDAAENGAAQVERTGRSLRNEAHDIDIDLDIRRNEPGNATRNSN